MEVIKINRNEYQFKFSNSGHTIGNLLQKQLLKNSDVVFAGYTVPHPLESKMIIRIITSDKSPREIMNNAFILIIDQLDILQLKITDQGDNCIYKDEEHDYET